jgi:hypothetical protein
MPTISSSNEPNLSSALSSGASPKGIYLIFLLNNATNYFFTMRTSREAETIEQATAALLSFCPDKDIREKLWKRYTAIVEGREEGAPIGGSTVVTASVLVVGDFISYLSDTLEFTEKSTGGFL